MSSDNDVPHTVGLDDMIDIEEVLRELDRDLGRRMSIARRLEPILRDIVSHYGVPPDNWHSFGIVFRFDGQESGTAGLEVGGMALRVAGTRERHPGAGATTSVLSHNASRMQGGQMQGGDDDPGNPL